MDSIQYYVREGVARNWYLEIRKKRLEYLGEVVRLKVR
jgi:hypothetical protein